MFEVCSARLRASGRESRPATPGPNRAFAMMRPPLCTCRDCRPLRSLLCAYTALLYLQHALSSSFFFPYVAAVDARTARSWSLCVHTFVRPPSPAAHTSGQFAPVLSLACTRTSKGHAQTAPRKRAASQRCGTRSGICLSWPGSALRTVAFTCWHGHCRGVLGAALSWVHPACERKGACRALPLVLEARARPHTRAAPQCRALGQPHCRFAG